MKWLIRWYDERSRCTSEHFLSAKSDDEARHLAESLASGLSSFTRIELLAVGV